MNPSSPATDSPARKIESRPGRTMINPVVVAKESNQLQTKQRLIALFNKFDVKKNGILELTQIHAMVKAIMIPTSSTKKKESSNIANVILQSLDKVRFVCLLLFVLFVCLLFFFLFFPSFADFFLSFFTHTFSLFNSLKPNRTKVVVLTRKSLLPGFQKVHYFNQNKEKSFLKEAQYKKQFYYFYKRLKHV